MFKFKLHGTRINVRENSVFTIASKRHKTSVLCLYMALTSDALLLAALVTLHARFSIPREWSNTFASRMIRDRNRRRANVVVVIRLRQLVTETSRVDIRTRLALLGRERRINCNANDVVSRRYRSLAVAAISNKVLSGKREAISVGPTGGDSLIAGKANRTAVSEFSFTRRNTTNRNRVRIRVEHAETPLRRAPNLARSRIYKLVKRIMAKVEMVMATGKLKESVVRSKVLVWIPDEDVLVSGIRRHDGKAHELPYPGGDLTFD